MSKKKNCYNDKYGSIENIAYCNYFIKQYFEHELNVHRWIQLSLHEHNDICEKGEGKFSGT